jgi:hypothetical protein
MKKIGARRLLLVFSVARYFLPRKVMQLVQDLHMHCYRLHLRFAALCQSISLEPPYYTEIEFQGHPHHRHTFQLFGCYSNIRATQGKCVYGGGAGSRTPVFPPLLLIVIN